MKILLHCTGLILALLATSFFLGGCATTPVLTRSDIVHISGVKKILLAPPIVECIDSYTNNPIELGNRVGEDTRSSIISEVRSVFASKQIDVFQLRDFPMLDSQSVEELGDIYRLIRIGSFSMTANHQEGLTMIAKTTGASHILFSRCRLYVGPNGYWDPMSGAIASGSSRVVLEALLYSIQDKRIDWSRTSQARTSAKDDGTIVPTMTAKLIATLEVK